MARKTVIGLSLDKDTIKRIDEMSQVFGLSRSAMAEKLISDGLKENAMVTGMMANPILMQAFANAFGNPDVVKNMASVMAESVDESQLQLFKAATAQLGKLAEKQAKVVGDGGRKKGRKK